MTDSKITKKHHPSGSLARRILSLCILLLVIPLFLQSLFLYRQEYNERLADVQADLALLAGERAYLIAETVRMDWLLLEKSRGGFDGDLTRGLKQLGIERIPMPPNGAERFTLISKNHESLLVGMKESNATALIIPISLKLLAKDMPRDYPVQISLVDLQGKTAWENKKFTEGTASIKEIAPIAGTSLQVQLTVEKDRIRGLHQEAYYFRFATLVFFVGILGGSAVYFFARRIARPLKSLCKTMERVSLGANHARYTPDSMGFEINALGVQFNETLDALLQNAQEAEKERLLRERLAGELRIGHEIQESLLPSHIPGLPGVDIATGYFSAKEVNGDFYDLLRLENGKILIAICDTAGKGISACLFSLGLRSMIRALANTAVDLSDLVRRANDLYLMDAHESSMFSTLWVGIYDPELRHLVYCSQGHPPAALIRGSELIELWTPGIALGAQTLDVITTNEIKLEKGDLLVLYTDGIIEAHDPDNELFGKQRLYELLLRKKKNTAQQLVDRIIENVHLFSQGAPQHDDITLIVFSIWC